MPRCLVVGVVIGSVMSAVAFSIKDTHGALTTFSYSSSGYVSQIQDPTGRLYKYSQNSSNQLASYTDPAGKVTYYGYDAYGNLNQVTTAQGNITNIAYDGGNTDRVTSVSRRVHPTDSTGPTTSYTYATASGSCPANPGWVQTTVTDPDGHASVYCADDQGRVTKSIDANGHARSESYSPDGFIASLTSALTTPTTFTYKSDGTVRWRSG